MDCQGRLLWRQRLPTYKSLSKEFTIATGQTHCENRTLLLPFLHTRRGTIFCLENGWAARHFGRQAFATLLPGPPTGRTTWKWERGRRETRCAGGSSSAPPRCW
jgi:hypothetical protein